MTWNRTNRTSNCQQDRIKTPNLCTIKQPNTWALLEQEQSDLSNPAGQSTPTSKCHRLSLNVGIETPNLLLSKFLPLSQNQTNLIIDERSVSQKAQHDLFRLSVSHRNEVHSMVEEIEEHPSPSHSGLLSHHLRFRLFLQLENVHLIEVVNWENLKLFQVHPTKPNWKKQKGVLENWINYLKMEIRANIKIK